MNSTLKYLFDYKDGLIKQGLGLDIELDNYLRFKPKQLNIILGHDNVGKTYWINWYFLALTSKHGLKWCIWSGEKSKRSNYARPHTNVFGHFLQEINEV